MFEEDQDRFTHLCREELVFCHSIHFLWFKKPAVGNLGCSPIKYLYMIFVKYFDSLQLVRRFVLIIAIYLLVVNVLRYSTLFLSRARGRRGRNLPPYTFTHSPLGLLQICSEELHKILQCYNSQWNSDETCDVSMLTRARESSQGAC